METRNQNILFFIQPKKETHTGLEEPEVEETMTKKLFWTNYSFNVMYENIQVLGDSWILSHSCSCHYPGRCHKHRSTPDHC